MNNLLIGTIQTMTVLRKIDTGYVLQKDTSEALLHHNETEDELQTDQEIDVFLYQDKKGQAIATTKLPHAQMDVCGWAEVIEVFPEVGAFVDIGISKDVLVSSDDLPLFEDVLPKKEDMLYVTLGRDQKGRLLAIPATEGAFAKEFELAPEHLFNAPIQG